MKQCALDQTDNDCIPTFRRTLEEATLHSLNYTDYFQNSNCKKPDHLHTLSYSIGMVSKSWVSLPDALAGRIDTILSHGFDHGSSAIMLS